jgi:2'-5' RNA ligase
MSFVVMLTLDPATTDTIERVEREIAAVLPEHRPFDSEVGPHITLAACAGLDLPACASLLAEWAGGTGEWLVRFESLGVFLLDSPVVFAAPVVTRALLALHERVHHGLRESATGLAAPYLPGNWVPHCTLAERIPASLLPDMVNIARRLPLPLTGRLDALQIAAFPSAKVVRAVAIAR